MKTWLFALAAAFALFSADAAQACMPMPPPPQEQGESNEAYAARAAAWQAQRDAEDAQWRADRQSRNWEEADSVFLARIVRVQPNANAYGQRVTLRAIRALKGRAYTNRFTLNYTEPTSCGPLPGFAAITGAVGDTYVVFVKGGRPGQRTVQDTVAPANITDERIRALLAAGQ
ncbi:MAG: hypothetical protein NT015_18620 [Alphaproteobacteria bacterium]|nr:hypothetical protein [Alphaproteobacteria bacterium]